MSENILNQTNVCFSKLLGGLIDPLNDEKLFDKCLIGYNIDNIFSFSKPVCFNYVSSVTEYYNSFGIQNKIHKYQSQFGFVIRGITTDRYNEAIRIAGILHDKFMNDTNFRTINDLVDNTVILESGISLIPNNKKGYNTGYSFTLEHEILY